MSSYPEEGFRGVPMINAPTQAKSTFFSAFRVVVWGALQCLTGDRGPVAVPVFTGPARGLWFRQNQTGVQPMQTSHSTEDLRALSVICQKGWTVWDCGSTEGLSTVLFSKFVGIDGLVVCFEPKREYFMRAYDNASLNGCNNILFHFATVGEPAPKDVFKPPVCARQLSLDEAYEDGEIPIPHLIRLDLTPGGMNVLSFGQKLIREQRPLFIVNQYGPTDREFLMDFARNHGYTLQSLDTGTVFKGASDIQGAVLCSPMPVAAAQAPIPG